MRRVVIIGLGPLTSVGIGKKAFLESLQSARSGIGPVTISIRAYSMSTVRARSRIGFQSAIFRRTGLNVLIAMRSLRWVQRH
jgi:hypothetical protein